MSEEKVVTKDVLKVVAAGGLIVTAAAFPALPVAISIVYKQWKNVNKTDLGRIIKRLETQQMISIAEIDGTVRIIITDKGKKRLLQYDFENLERKAKRRDGKWRLIIFDIPEGKKRSRNALVRKLQQLECIRLQDSVYASAYPCKDEIDFLCHYLEVADYVTLVTLDKFERGEHLFFKEYREEE